MRHDQRLVVGHVEYPVTRGADVVVGPGTRDALPQRAVSRREMVNVPVAQRVPGMVFGQPRRIPATGADAVMMVILHWNKKGGGGVRCSVNINAVRSVVVVVRRTRAVFLRTDGRTGKH